MDNINRSSKQLTAFYIIWIFVNIIIWSMASGRKPSSLWPFENYTLLDSYNISEFLLYVLGPAVAFIAYRIYKK